MDRLYQHARDDGERRTALFVKGVILVDGGKTDAALKEIQREYDLDAKLADTANMSGDALLMGNILLDAGRVDAAEKQFRQLARAGGEEQPVAGREGGHPAGRPVQPGAGGVGQGDYADGPDGGRSLHSRAPRRGTTSSGSARRTS